MRTDIVKMYRDIHGWVGIVSGLALFIAFFAGAITMFEEPLQRWASPPPQLSSAPSLARTPELIEKALAAHPEAAASYEIHVATSPERPARMSWSGGDVGDHHGTPLTYHASLAPDGSLEVTTTGPSQVAQLIDVLHQQVGLPFAHEVSMPIMGAIALLYAIALVSGTIVLLPSLVKDLFALRLGKNLKRMWLDLHNVLGLFSLPFHVIMALTAVVFAFHDQFYLAQDAVSSAGRGRAEVSAPAAPPAPEAAGPVLAPAQIVAALEKQAPGFAPITLHYQSSPRGETVRVNGADPRHILRGATFGVAMLDARTGRITGADYLPGHQSGWFATVTSFFALHFGNFGGAPVRWGYFLLGLAGAMLFYTGNLLWIESRRKRERRSGAVEQTRSTRILAALTVGVSVGCVAGIATTVAAAKVLPLWVADPARWHEAIYYAVFLGFTGWALVRGGAIAGYELPAAAAATCLLIPLASLASLTGTIGWNHGGSTVLIDLVAGALAACLWAIARKAYRRAHAPPRDSVWHAERQDQPPDAEVAPAV